MLSPGGGEAIGGSGRSDAVGRVRLCLLALAGALLFPPVLIAKEPSKLALTKAAFVLNFSKYTEWPEQAFEGPSSPLELCLFDRESDVGMAMSRIEGKTAHNRPFRVRLIGDGAPTGCHVVFVEDDRSGTREHRIRALSKQPVLTIGDAEGFAERGGVIALVNRDLRLGFEVNLEAAQRADLRLSSQLLVLARIVKDS